MQTEAGEVFEPAAPGAAVLDHAAQAQPGEQRGADRRRHPCAGAGLDPVRGDAAGTRASLGLWHAEWETLPELCCLVSGALQQAIGLLEGLEVDAERCAATSA